MLFNVDNSFMGDVFLERTKGCFPAGLESGGLDENKGFARVWSKGNGGPLKALYVWDKKNVTNNIHALVPVSAGNYYIKADNSGIGEEESTITMIYKVTDIEPEGPLFIATIESVVSISGLGYPEDEELPSEGFIKFRAGVLAAQRKACTKDCSKPVFIRV